MQDLINKFKEGNKSLYENNTEKITPMNLLKEKNSYINIVSKDYSFYNYFNYQIILMNYLYIKD